MASNSFASAPGNLKATHSPSILRKLTATPQTALCFAITGFATLGCFAQSTYLQRNLVSDLAGVADHTDSNLVNPWGVAYGPGTPFWISDNGTGWGTTYDGSGIPQPLVVTVPPSSGGLPPSSPTGIVFNGSTNFPAASGKPAQFIFCTEDGVIAVWNSGSGTTALRMVDNFATYKGLAIGSDGGTNFLYATDFHGGKVDVYDAKFNQVFFASFLDPVLPAGFAPFGMQNIGGQLYVTYARQNATGEGNVPGAGQGVVDRFTVRGVLVRRFATSGVLNSPWGLVQAPAGFGGFSGKLLIGNFGDGRINAFDPSSGAWLGALLDANNSPIVIPGLWGLTFGNGSSAGDPQTLYFTAGIPGSGVVKDHGLFGSLVPFYPKFTSILKAGAEVSLSWTGAVGSVQLQFNTNVSNSGWSTILTTTNHSAIVPAAGQSGFFRLQIN